jgi:hypothetical protein
LANIQIDIFIVDHACETMHNACKTGALIRKFGFRANKTMWWPTVGGGGGLLKAAILFFWFPRSQCKISKS